MSWQDSIDQYHAERMVAKQRKELRDDKIWQEMIEEYNKAWPQYEAVLNKALEEVNNDD